MEQNYNNNSGRVDFSSVRKIIDYPDFLDVQLGSFKRFFQVDTTGESKCQEGLFKVFSENFPITDSKGLFVLEFIDCFVDPPRYSIQECIDRGLTYSVPLKAKLRLYCTDPEHEDFETIVQDVYLGTIPYMTPRGSFIINGAERVIVSQLHRSPGVFFGSSRHINGTRLYSARIIPFKGSWIEFASDINNVMYAYIDRKKKFPVTTLLRAIGYDSDKDILSLFDLVDEVKIDESNKSEYIGRKLAARVLQKWTEDFVDEETGEVVSLARNSIIVDRGTTIDEGHINLILEANIDAVVLEKDDYRAIDYAIVYNTLQKDESNSEQEAVEYIYRQLRSSDPPDEETARGIIDKLFFSDKRYDLGDVGRYKINRKLNLNIDQDTKVLTKDDIIAIVKHLINLSNSKAEVDDIDHLSNRRVRTVGEQLYAQFGVGLARMARTIRERMNIRDNEVFTPADLINARTLTSVINTFFGTNQLSQFMDQTNPLAEVTHKRRLSALGPGGLSRERAGFEVRDVHYTHYGRLCPIETPEGPNIGLISSLCVHAKVNSLGFIETPYRRVSNGKVLTSEDVEYLSSEDENGKIIVQANSAYDNDGNFLSDKLKARYEGDFPVVDPAQADYIDIAPNQITSIAASLIPFLEHDDANRALMGSNMQRQAVPLLKPEVPIVGTGLEKRVVMDTRVLISAEHDGEITYVDAERILIKYDIDSEDMLVSFDSPEKEYILTKFKKTNQSTCINLKPIVKKGQKIKKGDVLTQGYATEHGELALGHNLKVGFMPWQGFNFEDAIVISERVIKQDLFTSIHIEEFTLEVRDTRLGEEEFTADIPNVSEDLTKDLDENGIIRIGAEIHENDILIGKITPKGETDPSPEEKLLRAIFGDKAGDVKDASLRAPASVEGVVITTNLFSRVRKTTKGEEKALIEKLDLKLSKKLEDLRLILIDKLYSILNGQVSIDVKNYYGDLVLPGDKKITKELLSKIKYDNIELSDWTKSDKHNALVKQLLHNYNIKVSEVMGEYRREKFTLTVGDELPSGIIQMAKVYIANKRKLKIGDKMAGRHGNKGIVAKIVREEDMPFLEDGTPIDIVLNPLGVPSRMNLGQIYESVLGWAGQKLGVKFATPIFDGASSQDVEQWLEKAELPKSGRTYLYDGLTGQKFDQPTTVGVIYMIKLAHMVDDKMHARSIGPYSLITQQPLGGKAQFGGQRFGEMEVWALEAFGASNILQEMLTVKSDDVIGRAKTYEAIVKGDNMPTPNIPESFNVLTHELKGLLLNLKFDK
ncbi:MAG: DNA-directed RNA polymerase subunit beta [Solitalea-like symbiont of Tyrophagus putrescentiae]